MPQAAEARKVKGQAVREGRVQPMDRTIATIMNRIITDGRREETKSEAEWLGQLRTELAAIGQAVDGMGRRTENFSGAERNPVTATMEAILTCRCEGMPIHAREYAWAEQPEHGHLRGAAFDAWHPTVDAIRRIALEPDGPNEDTDTKAWLHWCSVSARRYMGWNDRPDETVMRSGPAWIMTPNGPAETAPAKYVKTLLEAILPQCVRTGSSAFTKGLMLEHVLIRIHPLPDGNGRLARLAANRITPGRTLPADTQHVEYCRTWNRIRTEGNATEWVGLRAEQLARSAEMPTSSIGAALDWLRDESWTADPGFGSKKLAEHYQNWMLVQLPQRKRRQEHTG